MTAAEQAIARSISHDEIVFLDYSEELESELRELADQSVNAGEVVEFWGGEAYGSDDWRVHLRRTRTGESDDGPKS